MPDNLSQEAIRFKVYKLIQSYKGYIPSINFNEYEYSLYLEYASPEELEQDIVKEATYRKIVAHDNCCDEDIIDEKIRWRYF